MAGRQRMNDPEDDAEAKHSEQRSPVPRMGDGCDLVSDGRVDRPLQVREQGRQ